VFIYFSVTHLAAEKLRVELYKTVKISRNLFLLTTMNQKIDIFIKWPNKPRLVDFECTHEQYTVSKIFYVWTYKFFLCKIDEVLILMIFSQFSTARCRKSREVRTKIFVSLVENLA